MPTINYSLYAIPAAYFLALSPHVYAITLMKRAGNGVGFDNANPRNSLLNVKGHLPQSTYETVQRAEAAQNNGFENLGLFAAAIVAGNMARLPVTDLNRHALVYLGTRVLYNVLYVSIATQKRSLLRSVTYFTGLGFVFNLLIQAGIKLNDGESW